MAINVRFSAADWERIERDWSAWWAGELDRPLVMIRGWADPAHHPAPHNYASNYPLSVPADTVLDAYQEQIEATTYYGDAYPKWWPNFGPGIVAGFLGQQVHSVENTVWFSPAADTPIEQTVVRYRADNPWWCRVRDLTERAVKRWGNQVVVAVTDLGGNLDVIASLRNTQRLLLELYDAPSEVDRLVSEVTPLWLRYYDELYEIVATGARGTTPWADIWSPQRCYMLQCDFSYMISPRMFERFVLPDLAACCQHLDHAFYHLDGKGELAHLDMLLSLERLRGIQWVPGDGVPPPEEWLPLLERMRDRGKLCQLNVTPQGALQIVRALGGRGFALSIKSALGPDEANDLLRALGVRGG